MFISKNQARKFIFVFNGIAAAIILIGSIDIFYWNHSAAHSRFYLAAAIASLAISVFFSRELHKNDSAIQKAPIWFYSLFGVCIVYLVLRDIINLFGDSAVADIIVLVLMVVGAGKLLYDRFRDRRESDFKITALQKLAIVIFGVIIPFELYQLWSELFR